MPPHSGGCTQLMTGRAADVTTRVASPETRADWPPNMRDDRTRPPMAQPRARILLRRRGVRSPSGNSHCGHTGVSDIVSTKRSPLLGSREHGWVDHPASRLGGEQTLCGVSLKRTGWDWIASGHSFPAGRTTGALRPVHASTSCSRGFPCAPGAPGASVWPAAATATRRRGGGARADRPAGRAACPDAIGPQPALLEALGHTATVARMQQMR
jgi:hypothetical protein